MEYRESPRIHAVREILEYTASAVSLAGISGKILLNYQNIGIRVVLLYRNRTGKSSDTAAQNKDITKSCIHNLPPFPYLYASNDWCMCSLVKSGITVIASFLHKAIHRKQCSQSSTYLKTGFFASASHRITSTKQDL